MKKADVIIAAILVVAVVWIGLVIAFAPKSEEREHQHEGHVHTATCGHHEHEHEHDHEHNHEHNHEHEHEHNHEHEHDAEHGIEISLSATALKNIGLDTEAGVTTLEIGTHTRTHSIPAIIEEFVGRTTCKVPAPLAGIVTKIYHEPGESVAPGEPLFDLSLSLPEMMEAQLTFLKLRETETFLEREIAEIDANLSGMAPQRRRELDVRLKETRIETENQYNTLRVLGLPEDVLNRLASEKKPIVHLVTVPVPPVGHHGLVSEQNPGETETSVVFETLFVNVGETVALGDALCDVCDLCKLTVRGEAFAMNEEVLLDALRNPETPVRVTFAATGKAPLENLRLRMVESKIDENNRTLSCYADFQNVKLSVKENERPDATTHPHKPYYIHWLYKPGQRCQMEIAYETIPNVFIVPTGAVARELQETFIFELEEELENGEKVWHRHPVHMLFRTREKAVLANDGDLKPGMKIAAQGASFIQDAIRAQSGSGTKIDPHAGHNH